MIEKKLIITQSNYIPWKGYFDSIQLVDEIILYDNAQYTRRDWRNRNRIKTPQGLQWLSIPVEVKGKYFQSVKDTKISDTQWNKKHWRMIESNYRCAPFFDKYRDTIEELYLNCDEDYLSLINYRFLEGINRILGINTPMRFSSDFEFTGGKTEKLVELCKKAGATDYYTGPSAKNYMDENIFEQHNIRVHYLDYSDYPKYPQSHGDFTHHVTILDMIFNTGHNSHMYMKYF